MCSNFIRLYHYLLDTRHKNYDTLGFRKVYCVTKSINPRGDWLQSSPTDTLLVSSIQGQRLHMWPSVDYKNWTLSEVQ